MSSSRELSTNQIEYTLTWEEYLELYSESWDKPNLVAVVTTVACAVIFGLVAFLLFQATGGQDSNVLWIFWALPGMLIAFSVWELLFRARRSNDNKRKEIRSSFEKFYQDPQIFKLDEQGWKHETPEKNQEGTWASVLLLLNRPSIIALRTKDALVLVPKRLLQSKDLASVKLALSGAGPAYIFAGNFWDWAYSRLRHLWKNQLVLLLAGNAMGVASIFYMARRLGSSKQPADFFWGELLCLLVLCLIVGAQFWYFPLEYACSKHHPKINFEANVSAKGIWRSDSEQEYFLAWKLFRTVEESSRAFLLYTDHAHFYLFSKRCLASKQQDEIRKAFHSQISNTSGKSEP